MRRETVFDVLGDNIGVINKHKCKNGFVVKLMDDDWGWYVRVVDANHMIHYDGKIFLEKDDAEAEYKEMILKWRSPSSG